MNSYEETYEPLENYDKALGKVILTTFILGVIVLLSVLSSANTIYPSSTSNMLVYYHLNNESSALENETFIYDFSGNQINATSSNTKYNTTNGYFLGGSFNFDGTNSYIQLDNSTNNKVNFTNLQNGFSISMWVYPYTLGELNVGKLIDKSTADNGANGFTIRYTSNNRIVTNIGANTNKQSDVNITRFNEWTFITVVINSDGSVNYYKNGQAFSGDSGVSGTLTNITTNNAIRIGQRSIATDRTFNGSISSVVIYNQSLTSIQVKSVFDSFNVVYIDQNTTLRNNNYNLTGSNLGSIIINNSNIFLDLNGSSLYGSGEYDGIYTFNQTNLNITNGYLYYYNRTLFAYNLSNSIISNLYFQNSTSISGSLVIGESSSNNLIKNNNIISSQAKAIYLYGTSSISSGRSSINNTIINNIIKYTSSNNGIDLFARANNNTIYNNTVSFTKFVGILLNRQSNYNNVSFNNIYNTSEDGIQIRGLEGGTERSVYNIVSYNNIFNASYSCTNTPGNCAQGFLLNYYADNNTIQHNTVTGSNGLCFETGSNSTLNIFLNNTGTGCRNRGFELNYLNSVYLYDNNFPDETTAYSFLSGSLLLGFRGYPKFVNNYILNNNTANLPLNYTGLSDSLIYFSNGSVACSDISTCDGNINITLTPNNYSYVLDNFNVTEGVSRQFSPISVSGTSTTKTITSTLSDSVTATVIVNADCDVIGTATYQGNPVTEEDCTDDQATFILTDIPNGESILLLSENGAIIDICAESDITFMDAAGIAGILLK